MYSDQDFGCAEVRTWSTPNSSNREGDECFTLNPWHSHDSETSVSFIDRSTSEFANLQYPIRFFTYSPPAGWVQIPIRLALFDRHLIKGGPKGGNQLRAVQWLIYIRQWCWLHNTTQRFKFQCHWKWNSGGFQLEIYKQVHVYPMCARPNFCLSTEWRRSTHLKISQRRWVCRFTQCVSLFSILWRANDITCHQHVYSKYLSGSLFLVLTQLSVDGYTLGGLVLMSFHPLLNLLADLWIRLFTSRRGNASS